ncbi:MAG: flavodoxin family protein [Patescibacteria group bacterium]
MKILSICGSPRKGNCETVLQYLGQLFVSKGIENEIVLLRNCTIERCHGCVEFCNHQHKCRIRDDMDSILEKMLRADAFVFISPNYFQLPTGLFKDFIDRSSVIFHMASEAELKSKKTLVMSLGTDSPEESEVCAQNIAKYYCCYFGNVVGVKSFQTHSELKGNYDDVFTSGLNPNIKQDLESLAGLLV